METLTYGRQKPENNDPFSIWWPAIASNVDKDDTHTHNGANSPKLNSVTAAQVTLQNILSSAWSADLGGTKYRQLVTLPTVDSVSLLFDNVSIECRLTGSIGSTGDVVHLTIEKVSSNTFYVYTHDNTLNYTLVYST